MTPKKLNKNKMGFTLVELMTVVAIVAILAAIALPLYSKYIKKSRTSEATANLGGITMYEEQYYSENDKYITAAPNPSVVPSSTDAGGRRNFNNTLTGWVSLGNVIPNNTPLYFQYEIRAMQFGPTGTAITTGGLVDYQTAYTAGNGYCSNTTEMSITPQNLGVANNNSSNWYYITAVGDQDGDAKCSLFIKFIDRADISITNDIE